MRCCLRHCHTASLRNVHTVKLQNLKHIGIRILPHGLAAVTGLGLGTYLLSKNSLVECKVKHREKNRLVGQTEESKKPDVDFEWKQFFQILWPDIYSLALAIVVGYVPVLYYYNTILDDLRTSNLICHMTSLLFSR